IGSPAVTSGVEYRPIGFVDSHRPPMVGAMGHISDFSLLLAASGAQVVVVCGYMTDKQFQEIVDTALAAGCQLLSVPRSVKIAGVQPKTVWRHGQQLVELKATSLTGRQLELKRVIDLAGATMGLVVLCTALAVYAGLDVLPQRVNVLPGEMSLVWPRPPLPCEVALYDVHHYTRFDVKAGVTGPWQVSGRNEITDFERIIGLETDYVRNWSLGRDLLI